MPQATIRKGSQGSDVKLCQERLTAHGFACTADGGFGPGTEAKVIQFQSAKKLTPDGVVEEKTWASLLAQPTGLPPAPDQPDAPWRLALRAEQAEQAWVKGSQDTATRAIDPRASAVQRAAALAMVSIIGIRENPASSNRGPALSGLVGEYVEHYAIAKDKAGTGLAWCALSAQWAQAEAMGLRWATPSAWSAHPLKNWFGVAQGQEDEGKKLGLWTPASALTGSEVLTGSLLLQSREGSGSDAGGSASKAGHTDLILGWKDATTLACVGGNLGDTAKYVERNVRASNIRGVVRFTV